LLNAHAINSSEFPPIIFASTGPPLTVATLRKKKKKGKYLEIKIKR